MIIPRVFFLLPYSRDNQHDRNVAKLQMIKIREKEFDLFFENKVQKVALLTKHGQTYQDEKNSIWYKLLEKTLWKSFEYEIYSWLIHHV